MKGLCSQAMTRISPSCSWYRAAPRPEVLASVWSTYCSFGSAKPRTGADKFFNDHVECFLTFRRPPLIKGFFGFEVPSRARCSGSFPVRWVAAGDIIQGFDYFRMVSDKATVIPRKTQEGLELTEGLGSRPGVESTDLVRVSLYSFARNNVA